MLGILINLDQACLETTMKRARDLAHPQLRHHPLPDDYLTILNDRAEFALTIVGKDPYRDEPTGIPFCKPNWEAMCDETTSGLHVLYSLGIDVERARQQFPSPRELFISLARDHGVAFLNLCYHYLDGDVRKVRHRAELLSANAINRPILARSNAVILCGQAKRIHWYGGRVARSIEATHPDVRNRISRHSTTRANWAKWWRPNALAGEFALGQLVTK